MSPPTVFRISTGTWGVVSVIALVTLLVFNNGLLDPHRAVQEDLALQWEGLHAAANQQIRDGHFPHWNPYSLGGERLFANLNLGLLCPGSVLFRALSFPEACIWTWILHYAGTALATYVFARKAAHLSRPPALLAGLVFAFGGFSLSHCNHLNFVLGLPFLPLMLLVAWKTRVSHRRFHWKWRFIGIGCLSWLLLSGGVPVLLMTGAALVWLIVVMAVRDIARRRYKAAIVPTFRLATIAVCSAGLTAIQWIPTLSLYSVSARSSWGPEELAASSLTWQTLVCQLLAPGILGNRTVGNWFPFGHEHTVFVGGTVLVFVVLATSVRRRRRLVLSLAALGLLATLLAIAPDPVPAIQRAAIPVNIRAPARFVCLLHFALAMLAAVGMDAWLKKNDRSISATRIRKVALGTFLLMSGTTWFMLDWITNVGVSPIAFQRWKATLANSTQTWLANASHDAISTVAFDRGLLLSLSMVVSCISALVVIIATRLRGRKPLAVAIICGWPTVELLLFSSGTWAGQQRFPGITDRPPATVSFLKNNLGDDRYCNAAVFMPLWENRGAIHDLANMDGYVGSKLNVTLEHERVFGLLRGHLNLLNAFSTKYVLLREDQDTGVLTPVFRDQGTVICENPYMTPRACFLTEIVPTRDTQEAMRLMKTRQFNPTLHGLVRSDDHQIPITCPSIKASETCNIERWEPGLIEITVCCDVERFLFVGTSFDEGWRATCDEQSQRILRCDEVLMTLLVPPGEHVLRLAYTTPGLSSGRRITLTTIIVLLIGCLLPFLRRVRGLGLGAVNL